MILWLLSLGIAHAAGRHVVLEGETVDSIALMLGEPGLAAEIRQMNGLGPQGEPDLGALLLLPDDLPGASCEPSYVAEHEGPLVLLRSRVVVDADGVERREEYTEPLGDLSPLSLGQTVCTGPAAAGATREGFARIELSVNPLDGTRDAITLLPDTCVILTSVDRVRSRRSSLVDLTRGAIVVETASEPGEVIVRTGADNAAGGAVTVGMRGGFRVVMEPESARTEAIGSDVSTAAQGHQVDLAEGFGGRTTFGESPGDPHPLPAPPALIVPGDRVALQVPEFRWSVSAVAQAYVLSIATADAPDLPVHRQGFSGTLFAPLFPDTLILPVSKDGWVWTVSSLDGQGFEGKASPARTFFAPGSAP